MRKTPHLANWSTICKDKKKGGLDIKDLSTINKALLGKWCWRFTFERDMLWKKLIDGKFEEKPREWCSQAWFEMSRNIADIWPT